VKSAGFENARGVPQGSSLSPIMFNFFIDGLIRRLHAHNSDPNLPSTCLFFADDGNLHTTSIEHAQQLLDIAHQWSLDHGLNFAPDKCLVVAPLPTVLRIGDTPLPQVESAKYLGIPFTAQGPDWKAAVTAAANKAKGAIMVMAKIGFNKSTWDPSACFDVYKLFIRPIMEYALQVTILPSKLLDILQRTQFMALRIIYGASWNTSKAELAKLSCL